MSKAYDSVQFDLFTKSLSRICMPSTLINILSNLLFNRYNRVITNLGLTNFYSVKNGIDQGETITPLFWRIYYDPLISYIATQFTGYTLQTSWKTNLTLSQTRHLKCSTSVLAYMDDTLWIASSLTELQSIISAATSFYQMADIQINPTKSIFCSNQKNTTSISYFNQILPLLPFNQPFKFLGCWFTLDNKNTKQIKLIRAEASHLIQTANTKQITDKQITYIINTVIIPTLEYRLHNIVLPYSTCTKILSQYLTIAKHKSHLSKSTPNSTMLNPHLYNIHNIWDIQLQHHISNFLIRINDPNLLGISTRIRLQQLQNNLWFTTNILQHHSPNIDGPNRLTTTFKIILLLKRLEINIIANPNITWPKVVNSGNLPLEQILQHHPKYKTFKQQLRHKQILYLEQLCSADNQTLLSWKHLSPRLHHLPTGKQPLWFTSVEETIIENNIHRSILSNYQPQGINAFAYYTCHIPLKPQSWFLTYFNQNIIIGKARRYFKHSNSISITHWSTNIDTSQSQLYPLSPISCMPCPGCNLNTNRISSACTIKISATLSTLFYGRIQPNKQLNLNANYIDLILSTAIKHPLTIPTPPTLNISDCLVSDLFLSNQTSLSLQSIAQNNYNYASFIFYTDGSVKNICTNQCSMGIGWVQLHNNQIVHEFSAQLKYWPSSYHTELISILSAIATVPRNSIIQIFTDSQSVISKYTKLIHLNPNSPKKFKFTAWPIWHTLLNVIKSFNIQLTLHKVQAHSDNPFNNRADQLANQHISASFLNFNYTNSHIPFHTLYWENTQVLQPI